MSLEKPNWGDIGDRELYKKLYYGKMDRELTEQEEQFCRDMYIMEEFAVGLDGD